MGAAESQPSDVEGAPGAAVEPSAMALDQAGNEAILAEMEGVLDRVPAEKITAGETLTALALSTPSSGFATGRSVSTTTSKRSFGLISTARSVRRAVAHGIASWRPQEEEPLENEPFFKKGRGYTHNDSKQVRALSSGRAEMLLASERSAYATSPSRGPASCRHQRAPPDIPHSAD